MKTLYKIENGNLKLLLKDDIVGGRGVSNIDAYFSEHIDIANAAGYYELAESEPPAYDAETQYIEPSYGVVDGKIQTTWTVLSLEGIQ